MLRTDDECDMVMKKAIITFGRNIQLAVAMEELAETISAISRVVRNRPNATNLLLGEIADAKVCLRQLELMFDSDGKVYQFYQEKIDRLADRVKREKDWE